MSSNTSTIVSECHVLLYLCSMQYPRDYTDGRGNVDRDSDEEDAGEPEAFEPQYASLPVMRPSQPPQYKPTPQYPHGGKQEC